MGHVELDAANELGGQSVVLQGYAERGVSTLPFALELRLLQHEGTEQGVPLVRKSQTEEFHRDVTGAEQSLRVRFDPRPWFQSVDFSSYEGTVDPGQGLVWGSEDQAQRAIRNAVVVGRRGQFSWKLPKASSE
jgi:hypothetical protein